jgi:hypothetical protein
MKMKWAPEEEKFLKDNYGKISMTELFKMIPNHSKPSIQAKAAKLGVRVRNKWTQEDKDILKQNYGKIPMPELYKMLPKYTDKVIRSMASNLKVSTFEQNKWTVEEDEFLKRNYRKIGMQKLYKSLPNHTKSSIRSRAHKKGLTRKHMPSRKWTEDDIQILKDNYETMSVNELSELLNRTLNSIRVKLYKLRLKFATPRKTENHIYTDPEIEIIKKYYGRISVDGLAEMIPNHSKDSIRMAARYIFKGKDIPADFMAKSEDKKPTQHVIKETDSSDKCTSKNIKTLLCPELVFNMTPGIALEVGLKDGKILSITVKNKQKVKFVQEIFLDE